MNDLEIRQLRYFVAVAEELHFGRAAERLGMMQPPLSRAIRRLERQVGVQLPERTTRHVALTAAGEVFLRDALGVLDAITAAARRARHAGGSEPRLRLALKADHDAGLLPRILSAYHGAKAALAVELVLGGRGEQAPALRDGRADVALVTGPFDDRGLDHQPLLTEPRLVALAASDPLAARSQLRLADFAGRRLPSGAPADQGGFPSPYAADQPQTAHHGLVTASRQGTMDMTQIFKLVELGSIVWFLPTSIAQRNPRPEIAYRSVADLEPVTLSVAWPQDARSAAVVAFVRTAAAVAAVAEADPGSDSDPELMERLTWQALGSANDEVLEPLTAQARAKADTP